VGFLASGDRKSPPGLGQLAHRLLTADSARNLVALVSLAIGEIGLLLSAFLLINPKRLAIESVVKRLTLLFRLLEISVMVVLLRLSQDG